MEGGNLGAKHEGDSRGFANRICQARLARFALSSGVAAPPDAAPYFRKATRTPCQTPTQLGHQYEVRGRALTSPGTESGHGLWGCPQSCRLPGLQPTRNPAPPRPFVDVEVASLASPGRGRRIRAGLADFITYYRIGEQPPIRLGDSDGKKGASAAEGKRNLPRPSISSCSSWLDLAHGERGSGGGHAWKGGLGGVVRGTRVPGAPASEEKGPRTEPGPGTIGISYSCSEERRGWDPARASFFSTFRRIPSFPLVPCFETGLGPGAKSGRSGNGWDILVERQRSGRFPASQAKYRGPVSGEGGSPRRSEARKGWFGFATGWEIWGRLPHTDAAQVRIYAELMKQVLAPGVESQPCPT